jgi:ABC-type phosphate/phosphonate transport system permease subunit
MNNDVTQEVRYLGPEATLEIELPQIEDYPLWERFLCALVGTTIGAMLAVVFLYFLFQWWVGTA